MLKHLLQQVFHGEFLHLHFQIAIGLQRGVGTHVRLHVQGETLSGFEPLGQVVERILKLQLPQQVQVLVVEHVLGRVLQQLLQGGDPHLLGTQLLEHGGSGDPATTKTRQPHGAAQIAHGLVVTALTTLSGDNHLQGQATLGTGRRLDLKVGGHGGEDHNNGWADLKHPRHGWCSTGA